MSNGALDERAIRLKGRLDTPEDFAKLVIAGNSAVLVRENDELVDVVEVDRTAPLRQDDDAGQRRVLTRVRDGGGDRLQRVDQVVELALFHSVFPLLGRMAKADGRVSEEELKVAETMMDRMQLPQEMREEAKRLFKSGVQPEFDLGLNLAEFLSVCRATTAFSIETVARLSAPVFRLGR